MKDPRIKKLYDIGDMKVYIVDGNFIRNNLEPDFTNFGQHYRWPVIPLQELWIDKEKHPGETDFFVEHLIIEKKLMEAGLPYDEALKLADRAERASRYKSEKYKNAPKEDKEKIKQVINKHLFKLGDIDIYEVDGEKVRDFFFIDFTEGGNDGAYSFMPEKSIWIDDDVSAEEVPYIIIHEALERKLINKGKTYKDAHKKSLQVEYMLRQKDE